MATSAAGPTHLGVGLYSISEAARLVRAPSQRIRRWIDRDDGLVSRMFDPDERTVSFMELMELHFISLFRSEGVSLQTIRKAARAASEKFDTKYPFAVRRFDTDGRTIFATLIKHESDAVVVEDLKRGQYVFNQIVRPFFHKLEYRGRQEVTRYWPLDTDGRVVLDPQRHFGKPIDAETGVPTRALYEAVKAGEQPEAVAAWFDVPLPAVELAVQFEKSLAA